MTEDQNKEFDLLQFADDLSYANWQTLKFLYNEKFREAEQRIEKLQQYVEFYQDQTNILLTRVGELEGALHSIQSYDRDTLCYDASDLAAVQDIAFSALSGEKKK